MNEWAVRLTPTRSITGERASSNREDCVLYDGSYGTSTGSTLMDLLIATSELVQELILHPVFFIYL